MLIGLVYSCWLRGVKTNFLPSDADVMTVILYDLSIELPVDDGFVDSANSPNKILQVRG